jgi:hypothetical protein
MLRAFDGRVATGWSNDRMRTLSIVLAALAFAVAEEPKEVRALRYRILVHESAFAMVHGAGQWIDEIHLPEQGIVFNVTSEPAPTKEDALAVRWRMHAFRSPIRNVFAETHDGEPKEHPAEAILLPRDLVDRVVELAEITEKQKSLAESAAEAARKAGVLAAR